MKLERPIHYEGYNLLDGDTLVVGDWSISNKSLSSPEIEAFQLRVEREFLRFARAPQDRLAWLTIIGTPLVVEPGDHSGAVAGALRDIERKVIARCRRSLPGMKIRGVHEVDLLAPSACRIGRHKADLLRSLGIEIDNVPLTHRILVPHLHCIVDRADHTEEKLAEQMRAEFAGPWRTMAKPLQKDRPLRSNLESLASYSTKLKVAYSDAWAGRFTKYADIYEPSWIESVRLTLGRIKLGNLYFAHGCAGLSSPNTSLTAPSGNPAIPRLLTGSTGTDISGDQYPAKVRRGRLGRAIALHRCYRDFEVKSSLFDARLILTPPRGNLIAISTKRSPQRSLAAMSQPGRVKRNPRGATATFAALFNPSAFHVGDLRQYGEDQLSHTSRDLPEASNLDRNPPIDKLPNSCLNIERIPTKAVDGVYVQAVAVSEISQHFTERRTVCGRDDPADPFVAELFVEAATHRVSLRGDGLCDR